MLIGLYHSLYRTRMVYGLFGSMVVIFSIIGYFQFHRFHTTAGRFQDISTSIKTILQVSTSAPFSLYVLLPYYETVSQISPLFFLVITYLVESLCIPLIVGAGNVFFNKYGNAVLKRRRKKRYEAFLHIWILLTKSTKLQAFKADNVSSTEHVEPRVSFIAFQDFIASLPRKYLLPRDVISELLVFIRRQILTDENTSKKGNKLEAEETLSKEEFFALLGCVYHGITITNFAEIHSDATADNTSTKALNNNSMNVFRDSLFYDIRYLSSKPSSASFSSSKGTAMELQDRKSTHAISSNEIAEVQNPMLSSPSVANDSSSSKTPTTWSDWVKGLDDHVQVLMVKEDTVTSFVSGYLFPSIQGNDFIQKLRDTCHQMVYTTVRLGKYENYDYSFSVLDLFTALIHFLLIIQLIYYTALYLSTGQYRAMAGFGYFLEACIVLELLIRIIGIGDRHFFHYEQAHVARVCLAFIVIVCMIALGNKGYIFTHNDVDDNGSNVRVNISSYYLFLVLAQCLNLGLALLVIRPHSHNVEVVNTILEQQLTVHKEKATVDGNGDDATSLAMPKSHINSNYWLYRNHHIRTGLSSSIANRRLRMSVENAFRSIFLFFIVLYFFTIIAQDLFCGVLDPDQIVGSPTNDDDASSWNNFANILNFNSYQQTFFTLFEVTVLGKFSLITLFPVAFL